MNRSATEDQGWTTGGPYGTHFFSCSVGHQSSLSSTSCLASATHVTVCAAEGYREPLQIPLSGGFSLFHAIQPMLTLRRLPPPFPTFSPPALRFRTPPLPALPALPARPSLTLSTLCRDEDATTALASLLASNLHPGDLYLLTGPVGAGKSAFSRAFIRDVYDDPGLPVPSPTFLLLNTYDDLFDTPPIHHIDLYRLDPVGPVDGVVPGRREASGAGGSLARLDLATLLSAGVTLIEWPDRLPADLVPEDHLHVHIRPISPPPPRTTTTKTTKTETIKTTIAAAAKTGTSEAVDRVASATREKARETESETYEDRMWREFRLVAYGEAWRHRLSKVATMAADLDLDLDLTEEVEIPGDHPAQPPS